MDIFDQAQDLAGREQAAISRRAMAVPNKTPSAHICEECEEEIPEARRLAAPGCRLCVRCQADLEMTLSHWR